MSLNYNLHPEIVHPNQTEEEGGGLERTDGRYVEYGGGEEASVFGRFFGMVSSALERAFYGSREQSQL